MYNAIWHIIKKECSRFLKDRRMILTIIILPALLMYGMYSLMGCSVNNARMVDQAYTFKCYVQNAPSSYDSYFDAMNFEITHTDDPEAAKDSVTHKDADLVVIFPEEFDHKVLNPGKGSAVPNIQVYYNSDTVESRTAYDLFLTATEQFKTSLAHVLDVNRDVENPDVAKFSATSMSLISSLIVMLLFSNCSFVSESIAGEKERGTFATMLVTPISRTAIAFGKIVSLSFFAVLSGLSNFIGTMLGMRNMLPDDTADILPIYSVREYTYILLLFVSAVLLAVSIISIISAFSKSVKEANTSTLLVTTIAMMCSMVPQLNVDFSRIGWRCIPILSTAVSLNNIFLLEYSGTDVAVTCVSNLVFTLVSVFLLSKMFNSEKIMFNTV